MSGRSNDHYSNRLDNEDIKYLESKGLNRLQAMQILAIAKEYSKSHHGKWQDNT